MFAELLARSNFSFLTGASHPEELVVRAQELGLAAIALTDRMGLYGSVRAHAQGRESDQRVIVGAELVLDPPVPSRSPNSPTEARLFALSHAPSVVLLARDHEGYSNLCRLLTLAHADRPKGEGGLRLDDLATYHQGLVAIVPAPRDPGGPDAPPDELLSIVSGVFEERGFLSAHRHLDGLDVVRLAAVEAWSARHSIDVVASARPLFHRRSRKVVADVLDCIREGTTLDRAGTALSANTEAFLRSEPEMQRLFRERLAWVDRSGEVASACRFSLSELRYHFPCALAPGESADDKLRRLSLEGGLRRYPGGVPSGVAEQIEKELSLIADPGRRAVLPLDLGDRRDRARAAHLVSGSRQRRQQRRVLRARHHRGRSSAVQPALRALHERRAQRAAGHRHRLRARAPRRGDPGDLRASRSRSRSDGERGDLLSRQERPARGRQGLRSVPRTDRSAGRDHHALGLGGGERLPPQGDGPRSRGRSPEAERDAGPGHRGISTAFVDPRRRLRALGPAAPRGRAHRAGAHARAHGDALGQGRHRSPRLLQDRRARAGHAHRDPKVPGADLAGRRASGGRREPWLRSHRSVGPSAGGRLRRLRSVLSSGHGGRVPDREPSADGDVASAQAAALLRSRGGGRARSSRPDPGWNGASVSTPAKRRRTGDLAASVARAHPRAYAGRAAVSGAGDADRHCGGRLHGGRGRSTATGHGRVEEDRSPHAPPGRAAPGLLGAWDQRRVRSPLVRADQGLR